MLATVACDLLRPVAFGYILEGFGFLVDAVGHGWGWLFLGLCSCEKLLFWLLGCLDAAVILGVGVPGGGGFVAVCLTWVGCLEYRVCVSG